MLVMQVLFIELSQKQQIRKLEYTWSNSANLRISSSIRLWRYIEWKSLQLLDSYFVFCSWSATYRLLQYVAILYKIIGVVYILGPIRTEMLEAQLQPRFGLAIVMNYSSLLHFINVGLILIAQAEHVPWGINWVNMTLECNQSRR